MAILDSANTLQLCMKIETKEIKSEDKSDDDDDKKKVKSYVFGDNIFFDVPEEYLCGDQARNVTTLIETKDGLKIDACFTFENCDTGSLIDFDPFIHAGSTSTSNANILSISYMSVFISFLFNCIYLVK